MYKLSINNRLSGFLNPPLTQAQQKFLNIQGQDIVPTPTGADGNVIYRNKIILNYADIKDQADNPNLLYDYDINNPKLIPATYLGLNSNNPPLRIYKNIKTGVEYADLGNIAPLLVRVVKFIDPISPPPTTDIPTQSQDPNCPCDCTKQTIVEKVYLSPIQIKRDDTPVKLKTNKRICKSKDNQTKYMFDCNTSISEINRQLNLNGLADCPCDCTDQVIEQTYYITDAPCPNCIPFDVAAEKIICNDTDQITGRKIDCNDLKESLRQRGYTGLADKFDCMISDNRLQGLSESFISANDYLVPKMALGLIAGTLIIKFIRN